MFPFSAILWSSTSVLGWFCRHGHYHLKHNGHHHLVQYHDQYDCHHHPKGPASYTESDSEWIFFANNPGIRRCTGCCKKDGSVQHFVFLDNSTGPIWYKKDGLAGRFFLANYQLSLEFFWVVAKRTVQYNSLFFKQSRLFWVRLLQTGRSC